MSNPSASDDTLPASPGHPPRALIKEEREKQAWLQMARVVLRSYQQTPEFDDLLRRFLRLIVSESPPAPTERSDSSSRHPGSPTKQADLLQDCLTAVLPLCNDPEIEGFLSLYCLEPENRPDAPRAPHLIDACNAALRELRVLRVPQYRFRDASDVRIAGSGCVDRMVSNSASSTGMSCVGPDAVVVPTAVEEEMGEGMDATAEDSTDSKGKARAGAYIAPPKRLNACPEDAIASLFFSFRPENGSADPPLPSYTTEPQSDVDALSDLEFYSTHGIGPNPSPPIMARCARFAWDTLAASPETLFTVSILFLDTTCLVCLMSREGIMHLSGIDLIDDLPRFLLLLFALQRLPYGVRAITISRSEGCAARSTQAGPARQEGDRVLDVMTAERLKPMARLTGLKFMDGYFQAAEAHHKAWTNGIKHGDPTLDDLLYREN